MKSKERKQARPEARTLREYIAEEYNGSQRTFAKSQGTLPQQVTPWLRKGFIVVNGVLYSPRRKLIPLPQKKE